MRRRARRKWRDRAEQRMLKEIVEKVELDLPYRLTVVEDDDRGGHVRGFYFSNSTLGCVFFDPEVTLTKRHEIVLRKRPDPLEDAYVLGHEVQHAKQCEMFYAQMGYRFYQDWENYNRTLGYDNNPYEIEARTEGLGQAAKMFGTGPLTLLSNSDSKVAPEDLVKETQRKLEQNFQEWMEERAVLIGGEPEDD